jgi:hypothetical protein
MAPDPGDAVLALAAQLDDLRGEVAELRVDLGNWKGEMARLMHDRLAVKHLGEDVGVLRDQVAKLAAAKASGRGKPGGKDSEAAEPLAVYWPGLDPAGQSATLAGLAAWVDQFLRPNYPSYKLAGCWVNHPEAIWELGGIWREWLEVYHGDDGPSLAAALWWHERWLPGVLGRLERAIKCDEGGCMAVRPARDPAGRHPYES